MDSRRQELLDRQAGTGITIHHASGVGAESATLLIVIDGSGVSPS